MLGITYDPYNLARHRYIEYLWNAPGDRYRGAASTMLSEAIDRLQTGGVQIVSAWVLDGSQAANQFFEQLGFVATTGRQPITGRPGRVEQLLQLELPAT